jgi:magnesium-transporting ATPase (P-type)
VIFCRMAPLQKSQVVNLIKNNPKKQYKTCAVGDGGNDCAMLRESHLGIGKNLNNMILAFLYFVFLGIIGKEGLQAARESDFAIGRFRFLQEAILVHGYWYYHRLATLITYFFYRGVFFIFQIFFYGFDSGFSAQTIFHSTFVMMFTLSFTSVPVVIQGLTEQPYSKEQLLNDPSHYKEISRNELMSFRKCSRWAICGIWHALICYYIPKYVWVDGSSIDDYGAFSLFISSVIVTITDTKVSIYLYKNQYIFFIHDFFKILTETRYFTWLSVFSQLFSYLTMVGFYMILCHAMS